MLSGTYSSGSQLIKPRDNYGSAVFPAIKRRIMRWFGIDKTGLTTGGSVKHPWRTFEVTTRVEVLKTAGGTHIWLPAALIRDTTYQRTLSNRFAAEGGSAKLTTNKPSALGIVSASYPANAKAV